MFRLQGSKAVFLPIASRFFQVSRSLLERRPGGLP